MRLFSILSIWRTSPSPHHTCSFPVRCVVRQSNLCIARQNKVCLNTEKGKWEEPRKAHIPKARELVLTYIPDDTTAAALSLILEKMSVEEYRVPTNELGQKVGFLAG